MRCTRARPRDITLTGTGFESGATVTFGGSGITVNAVSGSGTSLTANVTVDGNAAPGARAVTVTNPDGGTAQKAKGFTVSANPTISSINPNAILIGVTVNVAINGSGYAANFVTGGGTVSFGIGVTVQSVTRNSAGKLTATVVANNDLKTGVRDVTVTNPDGGSATCANCLSLDRPPVITGLTPDSAARGTTGATMTVTGTGFLPGARVTFSGSGVSATVVSVSADGTTITLHFSVTSAAKLGARNVAVVNPDHGVSPNATFTVTKT